MPWLSPRGHLDDAVTENAPAEVVAALGAIHAALGGDAGLLAAKRGGRPIPDLVHAQTGQIVEVDEVQHFTTARAVTLSMYPVNATVAYDVGAYRDLIEHWRYKADRAFAHKVSTDFPNRGGRQAQRAYNDALRDLLAPVFTGYPLVRVAVPDRTIPAADAALIALSTG